MKLKTVFLCLILCIMLPLLLACGDNGDPFYQTDKEGCTCRVTFDLGNGMVNGNNTLLYCVGENSLLPVLGTAPGTTEPVFSGYRLTGYYVKNADGTETDWNFESDRVTGDMTLYARWEKNFTVQIRYGENNESSYSVVVSPDKPTLSTFRQLAWTGHTFYGFYYDAEYTRPVEFPYTHGLDPANTAETVYARYLDGAYTIIRSVADFKGTINAGTKYYLEADIDFTGVKMSVADSFSGAFIGNGHTISGINVTRMQTKNSDSYGFIGHITGSAVFENVTFRDITVSVTLGNEQNHMVGQIGAFAGVIDSGATLDTVSFTGSLTYDCCGRDLGNTLNVGEVFGENNGAATDSLTANVTVTEITD